MNFITFLNCLTPSHCTEYKKYLTISRNRFAYRCSTGSLNANTLLKYIAVLYNYQQSGVSSTIFDLAQAHDRNKEGKE